MKKFIPSLTMLVACLTLGACGTSLPAEPVQPLNNGATTYAIYPEPHSLVYGEGTGFNFGDKANLILEEGIDAATEEKAFRLLASKDQIAQRSSTFSLTLPNLALGIYASQGSVASAYQKETASLSSLFSKKDAYYLSIKDNSIAILGRDSDAVFMGLSSLSFIFEQSKTTLRSLTIEDYSDSEFRGFIEGYYGVPWTSQERISLMDYGERFKANIYIYAPKDDSYHASNWRGLYSEADLALLKEQIAAGARTKTRFAWSIHPFLHNPITSSNYDEGLAAIKTKFTQLYNAGVRQFVISSDDIEASLNVPVDGSFHAKLLNDMQAWCESKGDCYNLIFVPSAYCYRSAVRLKVDLTNYYTGLMSNLSSKVAIMWTGDDVCSSISSGRFSEFTTLTGRKPFFWLNWPVNDYSTTHLLMGKAEILNEKLSEGAEAPFSGIVTNPMQQAEASKPAIFAIASYAWNINAFDASKAYEACFPFVDKGDSKDLQEICSHLSNATLYEGKYFEESEAIKPLIAAFQSAYDANEATTAACQALIAALNPIAQACDNYLAKGINSALIDEIKPWVLSLRDLCLAAVCYCQIESNNATWNASQMATTFAQGEALNEGRNAYTHPVLNKISYNDDQEIVEVGTSVLAPFLSSIRAIAQDDLAIKQGKSTGITYAGWSGLYSGALSDMQDGNESTFAWFNGTPSSNACIRFDYGSEQTFSSIRVVQGNSRGSDFMVGTLEYSNDGRNFTSLATLSSESVTLVDIRNNPIKARFLRLKNKGTGTWVAIKEVEINTLPAVHGSISYGNIALEPSVTTSICNMIDGDSSTYTWFEVNKQTNAYIILDLGVETSVSTINFLQAKTDSPYDYFYHLTFSISLDGVTYNEIGSYSDQKDVVISLSAPTKLRYIKAQSTASSVYGVVVREFSIL